MGLPSNNYYLSIKPWKKYFPLLSVKDATDLIEKMMFPYLVKPYTTSTNLEIHRAIIENNFKDLEKQLDCVIQDNFVNVCPCKDRRGEVNLALVSILFGFIESKLTASQGSNSRCESPQPHAQKPKIRNSKKLNYLPLSVDTNQNITNGSLSSPGKNVDLDIPIKVSTNKVRRRNRRASGTSFSKSRKRHFSSISIPESPLSEISIENNSSCPLSKRAKESSDSGLISDHTNQMYTFPCCTYDEIESLYLEFHNLIFENPKLKEFINKQEVFESVSTRKSSSSSKNDIRGADNDLLTAVCQVIHSKLIINRFNDKLNHTQSVFSLLNNGQLDGFGLAFSVVAACQLLGYSDVWLALSEDYAWIEFGNIDEPSSADVVGLIYEYTRLLSVHSVSTLSALSVNSGVHLPIVSPVGIKPENSLKQSWLYVKNHPIRCNLPVFSLAAAVASIQPSGPIVPTGYAISRSSGFSAREKPTTLSDWINKLSPTKKLSGSNSSSMSAASSVFLSPKVVELKQNLLWIMYMNGILSRYPVGLTNLADLEEIFPVFCSHDSADQFSNSMVSPSLSVNTTSDCSMDDASSLPEQAVSKRVESTISLSLYYQAVHVAKQYYSDCHVYPYLYLATCLHRRHHYSGAMKYWSEATNVISLYNHSSEDTEVYKELLDVATVIMPSMVKLAIDEYRSCSVDQLATDPVDGSFYRPDSILDDPQCFAFLLKFVDNLCIWEEGSSVPVLHVGWVDKLMGMFVRFTDRARKLVTLLKEVDDEKKSIQRIAEDVSIVQENDIAPETIVKTKDSYAASNVDAVVPENLITTPPSALPSPSYQAPLSTASSSSVHSAVFVKDDDQSEIPISDEPSNSERKRKDSSISIDVNGDREALLNSLVSFCDQRLLNPAFLVGTQPTEPLMPADYIDPEQAMKDRLPANLLTPPRSGFSSQYEDTDKVKIDQLKKELVYASSIPDDELCQDEELQQNSFLLEENEMEEKESGDGDTTLLGDSLDKSDNFKPKVSKDFQTDTQNSFSTIEGDVNNSSLRKSDIQYFVQLFDQTNPSTEKNLFDQGNEDKQSELINARKSSESSHSTSHSRVGEHKQVNVVLRSYKMRSVIDLWGSAGRLNISAIKLALTAQSHVSNMYSSHANGQCSPYPSRRRAAAASHNAHNLR